MKSYLETVISIEIYVEKQPPPHTCSLLPVRRLVRLYLAHVTGLSYGNQDVISRRVSLTEAPQTHFKEERNGCKRRGNAQLSVRPLHVSYPPSPLTFASQSAPFSAENVKVSYSCNR